MNHDGWRRGRWRRRDVAAGLAIATYAFACAVGYGDGGTSDDTCIYMRYVGHALAGAGFVYNVSEPTFGITSVLWPVLMTPLAALFGNTVTLWKLVGAICFGLSV